MESPNTPMRRVPSAAAARRPAGAPTGPGAAAEAVAGATASTPDIASGTGEAEALAPPPSSRVGWRSQARPSGVSIRPITTPTSSAAVSPLIQARTLVRSRPLDNAL